MYIIFLGAPGAGKGTQAANVARELKLVAVASGDLFRQAVERGDELGKKVKSYMEKGILAPDEVTAEVVLKRMASPDCEKGVIFDGFPRNLNQARVLDEALKKQGKGIDCVVYIKVSQDELVQRLSGRRVCRKCQAPTQESQKTAVCRVCGGELYQRPDDNVETVTNRLKVYFNETAPLIDYYKKTGRLMEIDGEGEIADITRRIVRALEAKGCQSR
jgi:adenylate kinase